MKATVIYQSSLRLITAKSMSFPDGNGEAFDSLESRLKSLRGRRFYGLVYESQGGIEYYAGLVSENEIEEQKFAELGFDVMEIEGGDCVRVKLRDWSSKTDQIGSTFVAMIDEYGFDRTRPQMEFYRSSYELHLLVPVSSRSQTKRVGNCG